MNKQTGTGVVVFGIILIAAGAIMKYAVTATTTGFSITEVGLILLIVGVITAMLGLFILVTGSRRHSVISESVQNSPSGTSRTVESKDNLS